MLQGEDDFPFFYLQVKEDEDIRTSFFEHSSTPGFLNSGFAEFCTFSLFLFYVFFYVKLLFSSTFLIILI